MSKIKRSNTKSKIKSKKENQVCSSEQYPWFSFRFMTLNKKYNIRFLNSLQTNEREKTIYCLYKRMEEISSRPWVYWGRLRKHEGLETIPFEVIHFSINGDTELSDDAKIYVFRFDTFMGKGCGRILGFKKSPCSTFHVIGYDFDFSSYPHG